MSRLTLSFESWFLEGLRFKFVGRNFGFITNLAQITNNFSRSLAKLKNIFNLCQNGKGTTVNKQRGVSHRGLCHLH